MSFYTFFDQFKQRASAHDLDFLKVTISEDFTAREIRDGDVVDYGVDESVEGWRQAFEYFTDQDMEWLYTDHSVTQIKDNEWLAVFWVSIVLDNKLLPTSNLFFNTFRYENGAWQLVRSYIEAGVRNPILDKASQ